MKGELANAGIGLDVLKRRVDKLEADNRMLESKVEKLKLQNQQIIVMFKHLSDVSYSAGKNKTWSKRKLTTVEILQFMNLLVEKYMSDVPSEEQRDRPDLIAELIKKGGSI